MTRPVAGDGIGFARWPAQEHGVLWISGDTVLYRGVRHVAARLRVDTVLLHLGGVRFPVTGPLRYTMTAREATRLCGLVHPRTVIPIHYEGWSHFEQGRSAIEHGFTKATEDICWSIRWVPIGVGVELAAEPSKSQRHITQAGATLAPHAPPARLLKKPSQKSSSVPDRATYRAASSRTFEDACAGHSAGPDDAWWLSRR